MSTNLSVTATFAASTNNPTYNLTITTSGTGAGNVVPTPAGTNCGTNCYAFASGTAVELTATPNSGSTFTGWSGAGCSGTGACSVTMSQNQKVTASFATAEPPPTNLTGTWTGTITESVVWDTGPCSFSGTATLPLTQIGTFLYGIISENMTLTSGDSSTCGTTYQNSDMLTGSISGSSISFTGSEGIAYSATVSGTTMSGTGTDTGYSVSYSLTLQ